MAFEEMAPAKPKGRINLYLGMGLLIAVFAGPFIWKLAGSPAIPPFGGASLLWRVFSLIALLAGGWFLVRHFRGAERPFSMREKRYWWSILLPIPFTLPLAFHTLDAMNTLGFYPGGKRLEHFSIAELYSQPTSSAFAVVIALSLAIGTIWSLVLYLRSCDEQEVQANLWASLWGFVAVGLGAPLWHFLALGGLLPPVSAWLLILVGIGVFLGVFLRLKFR